MFGDYIIAVVFIAMHYIVFRVSCLFEALQQFSIKYNSFID